MALISDLENFEISELEKFTITQLEETFATAITSTSRIVHPFLIFNSVDRTNLVKKFPAISLAAENVISPTVNIDVINTTGFWNELYGDPSSVEKTALLKLGLPAKKTLYTGTGENIKLKDAEGTLTIRSNLYAILQQTVGSDDTPVTYGAELLTDGGLEAWNDAFTLTNWTDNIVGPFQSAEEHSGTFCAELPGSVGGYQYIQQASLGVTSSHCYELAFWHICDTGETNQNAGYQIIDEDGYYLQADLTWTTDAYTRPCSPVSTDAAWQRESLGFVVRADATSLTLRIQTANLHTDDVRVDDVALHDGNPAVMTWNILIDKKFDSTFSTSNTDIDFTDWDTWRSDCAAVELYLNSSFEGEKIVDILKRIAELSNSYIWVGRDGLVTFKRMEFGGSSSKSITTSEFKSFELSTDKSDLVNSIEVFYDYDGTNWAGSVTDSSAVSIASRGTYFKQIQYTNIWHETVTSATNMAEKEIVIRSKPAKYIKLAGLLELANLDLGQLAEVTFPSLINIDNQRGRLERISDKTMIDGTLDLTFKDLSSENFAFSVDSYGEFAAGTADADTKIGDGYVILKRNAGSYSQFEQDETDYEGRHVGLWYLWNYDIPHIVITNTGEDTIQVAQGITSPGQVIVSIFDEENVLLDTHTFNATGTTEMDVSDCLVGKDYTIKRGVYKGPGTYTRISYKDYAASGTYTSKCFFWETTVQYGTVETSTTIAGADTVTLRVNASTDACSSNDDQWPAAAAQSLSTGEESWDISADSGDALDDSNYCNFAAVLGSNNGSTSPKVNFIKIYPE